MKNVEIAKIVKKVQNGDSAAFEQLYRETFNLVYYYCYMRLNKSEVDDAVQEVYIKLYTRINDIKKPEAFNKMLSLFMLDICSSYHKKRGNIKEVDIDDMADVLREDNVEFLPEELLENAEVREKLQAAVDQLPEKQKEALILYYFQDLSVKEICEITGRQKNAILNNLFLARKSICEKLGVDPSKAKEKGDKKMMAFMPFMLSFFETKAAEVALPARDAIWQGISSQIAFTPANATPQSKPLNQAKRVKDVAKNALSGGIKSAIVITSAAAAIIVTSVIISNNLNRDASNASSAISPSSAVSLLSALEASLSESDPASSGIVDDYSSSEPNPTADDIIAAFLMVTSVDAYDAFCQDYGFNALGGESQGDSAAYYTSALTLIDGQSLTVGIKDQNGAVTLAYKLSDEVDPTAQTSASQWFSANQSP